VFAVTRRFARALGRACGFVVHISSSRGVAQPVPQIAA
jgi:hypothetical protein